MGPAVAAKHGDGLGRCAWTASRAVTFDLLELEADLSCVRLTRIDLQASRQMEARSARVLLGEQKRTQLLVRERVVGVDLDRAFQQSASGVRAA